MQYINNNNDNDNNGNLYTAFGYSKRFTITLKCGTHEKKKKQHSERQINDIIIQ